jgi:hypothetical protein
MALSLISAAPRAASPKIPANTAYGLLNPGTTIPGTTPTTYQTTTPPPPATSSVDYGKLLAGDPILGQALAGINANGVTNQAQLQAAQQRALIQYGGTPAGPLPGGATIDPTTAQLAAQNTAAGTSTTANLSRAYQQAQQTDNASLAARGLLRSGAFGQHAAEDLQNYNQAGYQATGALTDYLQGLYSGYLQQQQALQAQSASASNDALNRIITQIQAGLISGGTPDTAETPPPAPTPAPFVSTESSPYSWGYGGKR